MELRGATALVTGGNGGLGQRICHALAKEGVNIAVMYAQSRDQAESVADELTSRHQINAAAFACDITDDAAVERVVGEVIRRFGRLDILVNDAAYNKAIPFTDLDSLTIEVWDKIIAVNLTGPLRLIKAVAPVMKAQGRGRIVNISSVSGVGPTGLVDRLCRIEGGADPSDALHGGGPGARDIGQLRGAGIIGRNAGDRQSSPRADPEFRRHVAVEKSCRQGRLRRHGGHDVPHRNHDRPDHGDRFRPLFSLMQPD